MRSRRRLVSKQELYDAVWPDVTVSDDSIVQGIWELRQKLGDDDHTLIKTVSRRGYLLDAAISAEAPQSPPDDVAVAQPEGPPTQQIGARQHVRAILRSHGLFAGLVIAASVLSGGLAIYLLGWVMLPSQGQISSIKGVGLPSFKDCADCPEMVALPAGEFMMGSPGVTEGFPRREVIKTAIAIGRFEITVDQLLNSWRKPERRQALVARRSSEILVGASLSARRRHRFARLASR